MKTIWKYPLQLTSVQTIQVPANAGPLSFGFQDGVPVIWFMVNTDNYPMPRTVYLAWTGEHLSSAEAVENYVGTATHEGLVYHCFAP